VGLYVYLSVTSLKIGLSGKIRTCAFLLPKQADYRFPTLRFGPAGPFTKGACVFPALPVLGALATVGNPLASQAAGPR
jgi:hypothetical protein